MADKEKNVVLNFKMDGQVKYAETLREINAVMNTAAKEYKNHVAAMGKDADATDKLAAEKKKLEIQMEGAQKRTKMLRGQYEAMSKDTKTTTGQLTQMYGKLLDSEKAEIALKKSLDRVNDGLSDQAQEARDAQKTLNDLKEENKSLEAEQKKLNSSFKLQREELSDNADEAEKLELAQKQLTKQTELSERTIQNLERQLEAAKDVYGENSIEVMQFETKLNDARTTIAKFEKSLDGIETSSDNAGDGLEELGKKMDLNNLLEATELLQGVSDKLFEVGQASFTSAMEFGDSQANLQANLGLTADEAEKLNDVVDQVFRNGVVGSVDEATEAVIITKQTFEDLNNVDLEKITNKVTTIAKRTGTDVKENLRGAEQLMNGFGLTGEEALDLIASGYQNGLNRSDDFMDTLVEYAPLFEQAGYSADEMLQIMKNGLENGARNTDLVADAVKELQIRMGDGSFEESLENFSDDTADAFEKWKDGEATVADVATSVQKDLEKMAPVEQQEALSNISTQFEDLGINASANLFKIGDEFDNVNGKADEMSQKTPGEEWESALRELEQTLIPIGQNLADSFAPFLEVLSKMAEWFANLPGPVQTFITVFGGVIALATVAIPIILGLAAAVTALQVPLLPIIAIVVGVAAAIAGLVLVIQNWGAITDWVGEKWDQFSAWLSETIPKLVENFTQWFTDMKDGAVNKFNELKDGAINKVKDLKTKAIETIQSFKDGIVNKANEIKDGFIGKVNGLKDGAIEKFDNLKSKAKSIFDSIIGVITNPVESAKDAVKKAIDKMIGFMDFEWSLPKLKMPSVSVEMKKNSWGIPYPDFDIDWYAQGGIMTRPTVFGRNGNNLMAGGEAGPEGIIPLNEKTLGDIGKGIASTMGRDKQPIVVQLVADKRVLAQTVVDDVTEIQERNKKVIEKFR